MDSYASYFLHHDHVFAKLAELFGASFVLWRNDKLTNNQNLGRCIFHSIVRWQKSSLSLFLQEHNSLLGSR
jgi:hypothetical protein